MINLPAILFLLSLPAGAGQSTCDLGPRIDDSAHPEHTCPAEMLRSDCYWMWHCCEDRHGHPVRPFLDEVVTCAGDDRRPSCGPAADLTAAGACRPHGGAHATEAGIAAYCARFYPGDPACGAR